MKDKTLNFLRDYKPYLIGILLALLLAYLSLMVYFATRNRLDRIDQNLQLLRLDQIYQESTSSSKVK